MQYTDADTAAIKQLSAIVNGDPTPEQITRMMKGNPFYEATYRAVEEALLQNATTTGGQRGGNTATGPADFGSDTLARV
ncbi:hypothetical protein [Sphingomonas sp. TZW2008]|uniref:hypothetical protein n=1 Tax=Sphingomonas sp. TZW2008 TaxID=1917973 RepID=UPI0015C50E90|nr:hypothetical protein [Sphingomonas sp. TZW2008]